MGGRHRGEAGLPKDGDPVEQFFEVAYLRHPSPPGRVSAPRVRAGYDALFSLNSLASQPLPAVLAAGVPSSMTTAPGSG